MRFLSSDGGTAIDARPYISRIAINDIVIDVNISKLVIHVRTIPRVDELATATNPASASPPVIKRAGAIPIPIAVQP